jgi:replicative DNA helicase
MVTEALKVKEWLDLVGGPYYVTRLTNAVVSSANIESHARIILQMWIYRKLIKLSGETLTSSYEAREDPFDLMDSVEAGVYEIQTVLSGARSISYDTHLMERMRDVLGNDGSKPPGVQSGFVSLDRILLCFLPQLYVFAARPSMGKTAFLLQLVDNMTTGPDAVPVGLLELETPAGNFLDRHLANKSGIDTYRLKAGGLEKEEKEKIMHAGQEIYNQPIYADFIPEVNLAMIRSKARAWVRKYKIKALLLDYLQIVTPNEQDEKLMRERQVAKIATGLAALAIDLKIPVIAFAQLSRMVLNRAGNRPNLGDLRESGTIEAAARCIAFIHRPEYYGEIADENGNPIPKGTTEIIVAKNNEGRTGTANLIMHAHLSKFTDSLDPAKQWTAVEGDAF